MLPKSALLLFKGTRSILVHFVIENIIYTSLLLSYTTYTVTRQLPIIFGQTDYLQQLGTTGGTIANFGCYLTTFATLARACGKETDPIELNKMLINNDLYYEGNLMFDNNLTKIFPDIVYQQTIDFNGNTTANGKQVTGSGFDINQLRELLKDPAMWVILKIKVPAPALTHFALVTGVNGVIKIADPLTKRVHDFSERYGDPAASIMKLVVYKGTPAIFGDIEETIRIDRDINYNMTNEITAHMGVVTDPNDKPGTIQRAKEKIDEFTSKIAQLTLERDDYRAKYEDEQRKNIALNEATKIVSGENQDNGEKAYIAEHNEAELRNGIKKVAEELKLNYDATSDRELLDKVLVEVSYILSQERSAKVPEINQLREIIKYFQALNINKFLTIKGVTPLTPDDPHLVDKVKFWVDAIVKELVRVSDQVGARTPVGEIVKKKRRSPVAWFLGLFLEKTS